MYSAFYFFANKEEFIQINISKFGTHTLKLAFNLYMPIFSYLYLRKNFDKLDEPNFEKKYGTLYSNHSTKRATIILSLPIFCFKRFLIALGTVFINQPIAINIMIYIYSSLFSLGYNMTLKPLNSKTLNYIDNINEGFILISAYFMLTFSSWIYTPIKEYDNRKCPDNPKLRYDAGKLYVIFLSTAMAFNFMIILYEILKGLSYAFRKKKYLY